jgi:hypothetical protein
LRTSPSDKAQKARAWGDYEVGVQAIEQADDDYKRKQAQLLAETTTRKTRQKISCNRSQPSWLHERAARQQAEQSAAAAISSLEQVAKVKEEARGTVIRSKVRCCS